MGFLAFLFILLIGNVDAAALKVSTSTKNAVVGNTITVTVSASGAAGWEYCLNYNSSVFKLTSASSDTGGACVKTGSTLIGYSKVTFKLKAIKSGSSTIGLRDAVMYGDDGNALSSSKGSVTVTARTQAEIEASYSDNAYLKSLEVEGFEINPSFDKDKYEYALEVENNVTSVNVIAKEAESHASISGDGTIELSEGVNKVTIVVTAQKGNQKKYIININRKELDPINVSVEGKAYTVVRKAEALEVPTYYELGTVNIDGEEVPALISDVTKYKLVGLKDNDGNIKLYKYLENNSGDNLFERYYQFNTEVLSFVSIKTDSKISGYDDTKKIIIGNDEVEVYYTEGNDNYVLLYGMNMTSGLTGWYQYDIEENTFQRYHDVGLDELKKNNMIYFIALCVGGGVLILSLLVMLILGVNNSKMKKKNKKMLVMLEELNNRVKSASVEVEEKSRKVKKAK